MRLRHPSWSLPPFRKRLSLALYNQFEHPEGTEVGGSDWEEVKEIYAEARTLSNRILEDFSRQRHSWDDVYMIAVSVLISLTEQQHFPDCEVSWPAWLSWQNLGSTPNWRFCQWKRNKTATNHIILGSYHQVWRDFKVSQHMMNSNVLLKGFAVVYGLTALPPAVLLSSQEDGPLDMRNPWDPPEPEVPMEA